VLERLAVIGFGDFASASYVAASIANFYGEREIEIYAWDENKERCDAMCRVLRIFLRTKQIRYKVYSIESRESVLNGAQGLVNCSGFPMGGLNLEVPVFDVKGNQWWEAKTKEDSTLDAEKFQILRWINKEEYPSVFLHQNRDTPLVKWLNNL
jgi:hypothetical protein